MLSRRLKRMLYQVISIILCVSMLTRSSPLIAGPGLRPQPASHVGAAEKSTGVAPQKLPTPSSPPSLNAREEIRFDPLLTELQDLIEQGETQAKVDPTKGFEDIGQLVELRKSLEGEHEKVQAYFSQLEAFIEEKELSDEILGRHQAFVASYDAKYTTLMAHIQEIESAHENTASQADWETLLGDTVAFLEENTPRPRENHFDPQNLPHRSLRAEQPIPPKLTSAEWRQAFVDWGLSSPDVIVAANKAPGMASMVSPGMDEELMRLLATAPPIPEDLAETIEVQFTPEITQLAADLGNNPVQIYNWVHNNIEFVPTWGSIQGAQLCLETKACNAFDTASLLIALFRVSGIPARYQMGTIEVPIDQLMNWAGGFTDPYAAASLLASGGVPSVARVNEIKEVVTVKLEHVWVEAYVDYIPSRGAVHRQGDTWVHLDASFKQFVYKNGFDFHALLAFSGDTFLDDYINDLQDITPYQSYGRRMLELLDNQFPDGTIEEALGDRDIHLTKLIVEQDWAVLPGTLPYTIVAKGDAISDLPTDLRHKITFEISTGHFQNVELSYSISLPELRGGARVTLSYEPASTADEDLIDLYGGLFNVPAPLLHLKPVLKKDGTTVASGTGVGFGTEQIFLMHFHSPNSTVDQVENNLTVGSYSAIIIQLQKSVIDLPAKRMQLLLQNSQLFDQGNADISLDDDLFGGILNNIGVSYFFHLTDESDFYAKTFHMVNLKLPTAGIVTADVVVTYSFGVPQTVRIGGANIDIDRDISIPFSTTGDNARIKDFMMLAGMSASAWEHLVFESFFDVPSVSAVKLLQLAAQQGVPIHRIDRDNIAQVLPLLTTSTQVVDDIENAVNAGMTVTASQANVQLNNWVGTGYIVLDPTTGAAGYLIEGGLAGGGTTVDFCAPSETSLTIVSPDGNSCLLDIRHFQSFTEAQLRTVQRWMIVHNVRSQEGTTYVSGASDIPPRGVEGPAATDCSGLVAWAYYSAGISTLGNPYDRNFTADTQFWSVWVLGGIINDIDSNDVSQGDVIFFCCYETEERFLEVNHVAIYVSPTEFVHAYGYGTNWDRVVIDDWSAPFTQSNLRDRFDGYGVVIP